MLGLVEEAVEDVLPEDLMSRVDLAELGVDQRKDALTQGDLGRFRKAGRGAETLSILRDQLHEGLVGAQARQNGCDLCVGEPEQDMTAPFRADAALERVPHIEKLIPQPQELVAFGLFTTKRAPINSSVKSITAFSRNGSETGSISTR